MSNFDSPAVPAAHAPKKHWTLRLWNGVAHNKKVLALCCVGVFLFYWFEIRPVQIYRSCLVQSSVDARKLLASKAEMTKGTDKGKAYQGLVDRGMYLRDDYESFMQKCLMFYGMRPINDAQGSSSSSSVSSGK